jgi:hypothetical protein
MLLLGYNWGAKVTVRDYCTTKQQTHAAELSD